VTNGAGNTVLIGPSNLVQLSTLAAVVMACIGGTVWLMRTDNRLSNLEHSVEEIRDRWDGYLTESKFDLWLDLFQARNPELVVPKLIR
jgi:hypothetical protein